MCLCVPEAIDAIASLKCLFSQQGFLLGQVNLLNVPVYYMDGDLCKHVEIHHCTQKNHIVSYGGKANEETPLIL